MSLTYKGRLVPDAYLQMVGFSQEHVSLCIAVSHVPNFQLWYDLSEVCNENK